MTSLKDEREALEECRCRRRSRPGRASCELEKAKKSDVGALDRETHSLCFWVIWDLNGLSPVHGQALAAVLLRPSAHLKDNLLDIAICERMSVERRANIGRERCADGFEALGLGGRFEDTLDVRVGPVSKCAETERRRVRVRHRL
jgi:hypothetical protein